jgi:hypothetical protein
MGIQERREVRILPHRKSRKSFKRNLSRGKKIIPEQPEEGFWRGTQIKGKLQ